MSSSVYKTFNIDIYKLSFKKHEYQFEWNDSLFTIEESSIVQKGQGECHVVLDKSETMITLDFKISGTVELTCDRSLELFDHEIELDEHLILKMGDGNVELGDEIEMIHRDAQQINIAEYLYQYINLSIPMKRVHPNLIDEDDEGIVFVTETASEEKNNNEDDPRWAALKKLK
ncbi:MAG: DUF177 domain-containing protein [Cyclobacteriaceae bacterium]